MPAPDGGLCRRVGIRAFGMDPVAHGPAHNDENGYFPVRSFASLAGLTAQEDEAFADGRVLA
jgi:hypothetical protein